MVGYSGTPLPKKLGIQDGHRVALIDAPAGFERALTGSGRDVKLVRGLRGTAPFDVIVWFVPSRATLESKLTSVRARMTQRAGLWIAWPKRASGVATDVTEDGIRAVALPTGLVDNKVCAIDDTLSGLRLVIRVALRT